MCRAPAFGTGFVTGINANFMGLCSTVLFETVMLAAGTSLCDAVVASRVHRKHPYRPDVDCNPDVTTLLPSGFICVSACIHHREP